MENILLIGLGPHSKRIYFNYFKKYNIYPRILIDLESNEKEVKKYLFDNNFNHTKTWFLPDCYKDELELPTVQYNSLLKICKDYEITHIISSTEPKAHNMYLKFALENDINILSDKPITVVKGMCSDENIDMVKKQYYDLLNLYKNSSANCKIMCQRQYHRGYDFIKKLLSEVVETYKIPITYIDIYHCDGNWEMLHDLDKENHPYKYGYGKLYHSGYHFIDLLAEFLKINDCLNDDKRIISGKVYNSYFTPIDELEVFNKDDYKRIFSCNHFPKIYQDNEYNLINYGEKNYNGLFKFLNKNNRLITTVSMNLLHYGFSRRGWLESKDYYKSNGRIRHERINIQVGTLMNIQVHSYQSKEIKDRTDSSAEVLTGGLEHFDIDVYRNVDIIGGQPYERIQLRDLYNDSEIENNFIGYNEYSREEFLTDFLKGSSNKSNLDNHKLAIEILYSMSKGLPKYYNNEDSIEEININENKYSSILI